MVVYQRSLVTSIDGVARKRRMSTGNTTGISWTIDDAPPRTEWNDTRKGLSLENRVFNTNIVIKATHASPTNVGVLRRRHFLGTTKDARPRRSAPCSLEADRLESYMCFVDD